MIEGSSFVCEMKKEWRSSAHLDDVIDLFCGNLNPSDVPCGWSKSATCSTQHLDFTHMRIKPDLFFKLCPTRICFAVDLLASGNESSLLLL